MAKRKSTRKHDTEEVQGKGSYVVMSPFKVSEIRAARAARKDPEYDGVEAGIQSLKDHLVDWNWVGDDGNRLPKPSDDPTVVDDLTSEEAEFLANLLVQGLSEAEQGN